MKVFIFLAAISLVTVQFIKAQDDLDWDGFGEADGSLYKLTPLSIVGFNTEQSSTYGDAFPSSKAVDGDTDHGFSHTKLDNPAFWTVQLKGEHCIGKVTLYNRKDCCHLRLENAVVRAGTSQFYSLNGRCGEPVSHYHANKPGGIVDVYCDPPLLASEINVVLPTNQYLQLQEVMVEEYPIQRCNQLERRLSILNAQTEQSSDYSAKYSSEKAADGFIVMDPHNGLSVTSMEYEPWWRVDLQGTHCISKVVLFNRADCCSEHLMNNIVRAGMSTDIKANAQCGSAITRAQSKILGGVFAVYCGPPLKARYVSVDIPHRQDHLELREVEIYELDVDPCESDERQVSIIGKPTDQSSDIDTPYTADQAANGNIDSEMGRSRCTHTKEEDDPWWLVDLEDERCISRVFVINRGDSYSSKRLTNAIVRAGTSSNIHANPQCGDVVSSDMATPMGGTVEFVCDPPLMARYISVDIPSGTPMFLQLCEVMVKELVTENACREPEQVVEEEPQKPVENLVLKKAGNGGTKPISKKVDGETKNPPKKKGDGTKIRQEVPRGMGP